MIKKILALGLFAMVSCATPQYQRNQGEATKILNEYADNCIARECSVEENNRYCAIMKGYDRFFEIYEDVYPYKENASKIREAFQTYIENYCGPEGGIKWEKEYEN